VADIPYRHDNIPSWRVLSVGWQETSIREENVEWVYSSVSSMQTWIEDS
jgi:hypothetical protein